MTRTQRRGMYARCLGACLLACLRGVPITYLASSVSLGQFFFGLGHFGGLMRRGMFVTCPLTSVVAIVYAAERLNGWRRPIQTLKQVVIFFKNYFVRLIWYTSCFCGHWYLSSSEPTCVVLLSLKINVLHLVELNKFIYLPVTSHLRWMYRVYWMVKDVLSFDLPIGSIYSHCLVV